MGGLSTSSGFPDRAPGAPLDQNLPGGRYRIYDIGTPGVPWGEPERQIWRGRQIVQRSFNDDVMAPLNYHGSIS